MAALPTMRPSYFLNSAGVQWAVNAYLVVSAACNLLGGEAADRFGAGWHRWLDWCCSASRPASPPPVHKPRISAKKPRLGRHREV
jgi:hypothetical protein